MDRSVRLPGDGGRALAWQDSFAPVMKRILERLDQPGVDDTRLGSYLAGLVRKGEEPRPGPVKDTYADAIRLEREGVNATSVLVSMMATGGVEVTDRTFRGKTYAQCFVASNAIDWVASRFSLRRPIALAVCTFLWRTGRMHHVLRQAAFADDFLFFRFSGRCAELEAVDLADAEAAMRVGIDVADRSHLGKTYERCFVGGEAVSWLMSRYRLSLGGAEAVGQRLLELGAFHHVLDEHGFLDGKLFYRFRAA